MAVNSYSHRSRRLLFHALVKNAAKYRKDLYPGHDRHRNISQIPCIPLRPTPIEFACPLATYSRDYQRINPLDQRFPFPGQRGLNRVLFLLSNSIETRFAFLATEYPEKISFARFPFVCKCEQSGIHMYIRIDTTVKRSVVQLWIVIARNSKACDEAETRDASYVESTDRFPCSIRRWTLVKVTYTPRDGIFPGVNWIQVDRREIEWKPPRGTLERAKRRSRFETAWRRRRKKLDLLLFIIISRNEAYLFEHVLEIILPGLDHRLVP